MKGLVNQIGVAGIAIVAFAVIVAFASVGAKFVDRARVFVAQTLLPSPSVRIGTEFTGDDDDAAGDDDIVGALRRDRAPRNAGRGNQAGKPKPSANITATALRCPMGVGVFKWVAADGSEQKFEVEPQRDFTPDRMIVDVVTDDAILLSITSIKIGDMPQNPNDDVPMPAVMFAKDTTDAHVQFDTIKASRKLLVKAKPTAAPAAMTSLTAQIGMYGWMVRGSQG